MLFPVFSNVRVGVNFHFSLEKFSLLLTQKEREHSYNSSCIPTISNKCSAKFSWLLQWIVKIGSHPSQQSEETNRYLGSNYQSAHAHWDVWGALLIDETAVATARNYISFWVEERLRGPIFQSVVTTCAPLFVGGWGKI